MAATLDVHGSCADGEANAAGGTHPDIRLLVEHYRNVSVLHSVMLEALRVVQDLLLWKNTLYSVLSMLLVCVMCVLPELFLMVCLQAGVVIMLLGRWYSKVTPKQEEKDDGTHDNNAPDVEADMAEFVRIMHQVQVMVVKGSQVIDGLKNIANWNRPALSLCVTLYICLQAAVLVFLGLRWFLPLLPLAAYCFNSGFRQAFRSRVKSSRAVVENPPSEPSSTKTDEDMATSSAASHTSCTLELNQSRSDSYGFVQLRSRARWRGRAQPGNCTGCKASLAKLLKRKHRCNSCGLDFCGNCTVKVKKFLLGVTDPATSEESVRVCVVCSEQLKAMDSEISSFSRQRAPPAEGLTSHPTLRQPRTDPHRRSPSAEHSRVDTALCLSCGHNDIQHSCNSCGLDFCQNCTVEVKKSLLGATSPAAYEDSVRVCVACSEQLKAMDLELSSFTRQRTPTAEVLALQQTRRDADTRRRSPRPEQTSTDSTHSEQQ